MHDLLFLSHRIPFPPDKGDKIRSFHILDHLAARYRVHLGCFYDDPLDTRHIGELRRRCATVLCLPLPTSRARLKSLAGLLTGQSLTQTYFHDVRLEHWVTDTMRRYPPACIYIFGSAMAPYALPHKGMVRIFDMVDFDSEKWGAYAAARRWPLSWLYARECQRLFDLERKGATEFDRTLLVSHVEADLFRRSVPEAADRILALRNGVDTRYFDPGLPYRSPFNPGVLPVVFTGAMDYWPNVHAVEWFTQNVMPTIAREHPRVEFWIVGANPSRAVRRLAGLPATRVTGRVEDIRPYLAHAAAVVAPLQIARGIQNKVLEAMAMARPVIATPQAAEGILEENDDELIVRASPAEFTQGVLTAFGKEGSGIGRRARALVETRFQWRESWAALDALLVGHGDRGAHMESRLSASVAGVTQ